jgi:hypothetical protein
MSNELDGTNFLDEARRESILASSSPNEDEDVWLEHADTAGWE